MQNTIFAVGRVGGAPTMRTTQKGDLQAKFRLCITDRFYDRGTGEFRDGDTSWVSVLAYRRLAEHVRDSVDKGQLVMVSGKFKLASWEGEHGTRNDLEITADHIGPDLAGAPVRVLPKPRREVAEASAGARSDGDAAQARASLAEARAPLAPSSAAAGSVAEPEAAALGDAGALVTAGASAEAWYAPGAGEAGRAEEPPF